MHRLFVALRPPPAIRAALIDAMDAVPGARWQDDEQLHVTVRFLGEVERPVAEDAALALSQVVAPAPAARIDGVGTFAQRGRTDTLWARVLPVEPLTALHRKVDQTLGRAGIAPDTRRYLPHVTLARLPRTGHDTAALDRWLAANAALATSDFALDHLYLYESHLTSDGARYEPVMRWPLAGS